MSVFSLMAVWFAFFQFDPDHSAIIAFRYLKSLALVFSLVGSLPMIAGSGREAGKDHAMWNRGYMLPRQLSTIVALVGLSTLMGIAPAVAHHSFAMFDMTKSIRLEGTVQRFEWTNPHSWIFLEVVGPEATIEQWTIELPAAGVLVREGWTKTYLRPGERVVLHVNPLKGGRRGGNLERFVPPSEVPASP